MRGWLAHSNKVQAQTLADRLTLARLKEVWGDRYSGQTVWPDGITLRAVEVTIHRDAVQAAVFVGDKSWHLLKGVERVGAKTKVQLKQAGWFS